MLGLGTIGRKIFGTTNDRKVKAAHKTVEAVNALEPEMEALTDDQIRARTQEFRDRLAAGETLDDLHSTDRFGQAAGCLGQGAGEETQHRGNHDHAGHGC